MSEKKQVGSVHRQAAYRERQKAAGRSQQVFWLTEAEAMAVRQLLEKMREK